MSKSSTCIQCSADFVITAGTTGLFCSIGCSSKSTAKKLIDRAANLRAIAELEYLKNPKLCCHCEAPIPFAKRSNKFCSRSCSASFGNIGRIRTEESREKISTTLKTKIASGEIVTPPKKFGKESGNYKHGKCMSVQSNTCIICEKPTVGMRSTCSAECLSIHRSQTATANLLKNRSKYKGNSGRSWMEQTFYDWLLEQGIPNDANGFLEEEHFVHQYQGKTKHAWVDFLFPRLMLIIELDGSHHRKRKELDAIRDKYLTEVEGYRVVRITHDDYKRGKRIPEIKRLLGII